MKGCIFIVLSALVIAESKRLHYKVRAQPPPTTPTINEEAPEPVVKIAAEKKVHDDDDDDEDPDSVDLLGSFTRPLGSFIGFFFNLVHVAFRSTDSFVCELLGREKSSGMDTLVIVLVTWLGFGALVFLVSHFMTRMAGGSVTEMRFDASELPKVPGVAEGGVNGAHREARRKSTDYLDLSTSSKRDASATRNSVSGTRASSQTRSNSQTRSSSQAPPGLAVPDQCSGSNTQAVKWVQDCVDSIFRETRTYEQILMLWVNKVNEVMRTSAIEDGLFVELSQFEEPERASVKFQNIHVECQNTMSFSGDLEMAFKTSLNVSRPLAERIEVLQFVLCIDRWKSKLKCAQKDSSVFSAEFASRPDIKARLVSRKQSLTETKEEQSLASLVEDIATSAMTSVKIEVDAAKLLGVQVPKFEADRGRRPSLRRSSPSLRNGLAPSTTTPPISGPRLEVTLLKAASLKTSGSSGIQPYVVLELDQPTQRYQSNETPMVNELEFTWNQPFHFSIDPRTSTELSLEVFDSKQRDPARRSDRFIGAALINVPELLSTPTQKHVITINGRNPGEDNTGVLHLQFHYTSTHPEFPTVQKSLETRQVFSGNNTAPPVNTRTVTYTLKSPARDKSPSVSNGRDSSPSTSRHQSREHVVAEAVLRDIRDESWGFGSDITRSTMLIRSIQKGDDGYTRLPHTADQYKSLQMDTFDGREWEPDSNQNVILAAPIQEGDNINPIPRGRQRGKKRSGFMSNIQKRFAKQKGSSRSHSTDPTSSPLTSDGFGGRSVSADRRGFEAERSLGDASITATNPSSADAVQTNTLSNRDSDENSLSDSSSEGSFELDEYRGPLSLSWLSGLSGSSLTVPGGGGDDASSLSDISGVSSSSARTFYNEDSSMVLETVEAGITRHYLIPHQVAKRGKLKKKGIKLHIFMDHIFVAKHIKGGTMCLVCSRKISVRLGKQGYACRDCGLTCHKPCHVKLEAPCSHSSLPSMELYRGSTIMKVRDQKR